MTRKIGGPKPSVRSAVVPQKSIKPSATKPKAAVAEKLFPRTSWKDTARLGAEIDRSLRAGTADAHPRLRHAKARPDPINNTDRHRPPIAMRYGVIRPDPEPVRPPPIAMRYGVIRPDPNPVRPPPIAMRYGVIRPDPNPVRPPPIAMRYGVIRPDPDPVKPPPIAMRYGVIRPEPRDSIGTTPRR